MMAARKTTADAAAAHPRGLDGTTSAPTYEHWTCGTAHIRAERTLRILERSSGHWTMEAIGLIADLVDEAGPANCRAALNRDDFDQVPF